jgi:hypothetical protein
MQFEEDYSEAGGAASDSLVRIDTSLYSDSPES